MRKVYESCTNRWRWSRETGVKSEVRQQINVRYRRVIMEIVKREIRGARKTLYLLLGDGGGQVGGVRLHGDRVQVSDVAGGIRPLGRRELGAERAQRGALLGRAPAPEEPAQQRRLFCIASKTTGNRVRINLIGENEHGHLPISVRTGTIPKNASLDFIFF